MIQEIQIKARTELAGRSYVVSLLKFMVNFTYLFEWKAAYEIYIPNLTSDDFSLEYLFSMNNLDKILTGFTFVIPKKN